MEDESFVAARQIGVGVGAGAGVIVSGGVLVGKKWRHVA